MNLKLREKRGFNSQSKRFQYNQNETPGPGFYSVTHQSAEINSTSLSKKGTAYFPSLVPRTACKKISNYPAANAYKILSCFQPKQDFSKENPSMFQHPIASMSALQPFPSELSPFKLHFNARYIHFVTSMDFCKQSNNVSGQTVFMSKTTRGLNLEKFGKRPSPCHYDINDSLIKVSPKGITSCFKSKTSRLTRMYGFTPEPATEFCLTLSDPAIPPCKDPPSPGPGQYNPVDYKGSPKQDCSKQTAFVSNTGRWTERR
ncbi:O(6)-methylguanine-induced apoptosis 2 [Harpia harpyja]|uniref:O(6)-methylguanine-induced apoptosis 2 n=1 Tax=Harpia harpyja TaxID=202280 RepID=UPI0022B130B5|nr:O(6)-methylguanine-induced apoptosis 2 [Harpia harpyja]